MKHSIRISLVLLATLFIVESVSAQENKKRQHFTVTKKLKVTASEIWAVVGEDYGAIAKSHPKIVASNYINGSLKAGEGAERVCTFNEKGTKYVKEKMIDYDPENMSFTNTVYQAGRFPLDPANTIATYKVEDIGNGECRITFDMFFRTKPGFMGSMAKGQFISLIEDYFISIEHHARTGEAVTKENFKKIKKRYI